MPKLPRRKYGDTGVGLSIVGFPGLVLASASQEDADRMVAEAVELGVNYFEAAPSYGHAEEVMGKALEPYREGVFLASKTIERTREGAEAELEQTLKNLRTDHLDLYQLHSIESVEEDVDAAFAQGGAMEVFVRAREDGRVRFLGFSAHSVAAARAAMDRFEFDSVLFPVNFICWHEGGFGPRIIQKAVSKGIARLGMKALARRKWPKGEPERKEERLRYYETLTVPREAELAVRFALSQPITLTMPSANEAIFRQCAEIAARFTPIAPEEEEDLKRLAAGIEPMFKAG